MTQNSPGGGVLVTLPMTVNLMKLGSALQTKGVSRKLLGSLRTAWKAQSCYADLQQAQGACDALDGLQLASNSLAHATLMQVQSSLLAKAILLYVRATTTSSGKGNERGSIQLDLARFTPDQREDHNTLISLRNGAIGHVESEKNIAGDYWHREYLFAKRSGEANWQVASASQSIGFNIDTLRLLRRQLPLAVDQIAPKVGERLEGAMQIIRDLKISDAEMQRYAVNPVEWFGSLQAAQLALSGAPGDEKFGWTPLF